MMKPNMRSGFISKSTRERKTTMHARYLFRYTRYVLALLACVGFGTRYN
jgi:hypothetical protein